MNKPAATSALAAASPSLWLLIAVYAVARFLPLFGDRVPIALIAALHIIPPLLFALIHGALLLGPRTILIFFALFLLLGNVIENLGVMTGFPFGHYYFSSFLGAKLFHVPILLGLAYLGVGYLSWTLALIILGDRYARNSRGAFRVIAVPLVASFVMVAWDLSMDPVWSTIRRCWIWQDGGGYFGVPLSNFLGWFFTVYIVFQSFSLYLRARRPVFNLLPARLWHLAVLFYTLCAAGNLLLLLGTGPGGQAVVTDGSGATWNVRDILAASALVSIFTMGGFSLIAWVRLAEPDSEAPAP